MTDDMITPTRFFRGHDRASRKKGNCPTLRRPARLVEATGSTGGWRTSSSDPRTEGSLRGGVSACSVMSFNIVCLLTVLHEVKWLCRSLWWWWRWGQIWCCHYDWTLWRRIWLSSHTSTTRVWLWVHFDFNDQGSGSMKQVITNSSLRNPLATLFACKPNKLWWVASIHLLNALACKDIGGRWNDWSSTRLWYSSKQLLL